MGDETPQDSDFTELKPGQGGWTPPVWVPYAAGGAAAALTAIGSGLVTIPGPASIVGMVLMGLATGLGVLAGVSSAGPRKAAGGGK